MKLCKFLLSATIMAVGLSAFADEAFDIMKKSTTLPVPQTSSAVMILQNIEKNGSVERRVMNQYGIERNDLVSTVFEFKSPASVKDTRVLQAEKSSKEDDRWIYLPSMRTVRRIPASERYKQFVGCEFTYNDMAIRDAEEDKNEMLEKSVTVTSKGKNYDCWKIKATPLKKADVEYSYRICYIDKVSYLPMKIEFFDKKDQTKLMKTYTTDSYREVKTSKGTYWFREGACMKNEITGRTTKLDIEQIKFDEGVSDAYFTQSWLQTGKAK